MYEPIRDTLVSRASDKEAPIRVQAVLGLAKLMGGEEEEEEELEQGEISLQALFLDLMKYDPSAEVRRAALINLPLQPLTIQHVLARSRDVDPILRKALYNNILGSKNIPDMRVLTIQQREELISNGLGDREPGVRTAASGMISGWLSNGLSTQNGEEIEQTAVEQVVEVS